MSKCACLTFAKLWLGNSDSFGEPRAPHGVGLCEVHLASVPSRSWEPLQVSRVPKPFALTGESPATGPGDGANLRATHPGRRQLLPGGGGCGLCGHPGPGQRTWVGLLGVRGHQTPQLCGSGPGRQRGKKYSGGCKSARVHAGLWGRLFVWLASTSHVDTGSCLLICTGGCTCRGLGYGLGPWL